MISKLKFTVFFTVNFMMPHERSFPIGSVCNIVTDNKSPEIFDCLSDFELLRIFLFGLPDNWPSHVSVAVFCAVDDFLKSSKILTTSARPCAPFMGIRAFLLYFFC